MMNSERKSKLRALAPVVRRLVKSSLIHQAFSLEKVIATTFEPTDEFRALMRNVPQNYIENVYDSYRALTYKAWDIGYSKGLLKAKELAHVAGLEEGARAEAVSKACPLSLPMIQDLVANCTRDVDKYLASMPTKSDVYAQFAVDVNRAYLDGVCQSLVVPAAPEPTAAPETQEAEEKVKKQEAPVAIDDAVTETGDTDHEVHAGTVAYPKAKRKLSDKEVEELDYLFYELNRTTRYTEEWDALAPKINKLLGYEAVAVTAATADDVEQHLTEYAKLLGNPQAENIMRYYLGLGPKQAVAHIAPTTVGPYTVEELAQKVRATLKDGDTAAVLIDCLVAEASQLGDDELADKLIAELELGEKTGLELVQARLDKMSQELTAAVGIPGDFVFTEYGDDYGLVFASSLPEGPQGTMTMSDQGEIEALAKLGKTACLKDIKAASPKVGAYLGDLLTDIRNSKVGVVEGARMLKADLLGLVEKVFGCDGSAYLTHLKKR